MALPDLRVMLKMLLDPASVTKLEEDAKGAGKRAGKAAGSGAAAEMKAFLTGIGQGVAAAFSVREIVRFGQESVHAAAESERVWTAFGGTLKNLGIPLESVRSDVEDFAKTMQESTRFSDEEAVQAVNTITQITGNYGLALKGAAAAADLAAAKQMDLGTAATYVGRAVLGNTIMLERQGIVVRKGADALEDFKDKFGGLAAAEGGTWSGAMARLTNQWDEFKEAVGRALMAAGGGVSTIDTLIASVKELTTWVDEHKQDIAEIGRQFFDFAGIVKDIVAPVLKEFYTQASQWHWDWASNVRKLLKDTLYDWYKFNEVLGKFFLKRGMMGFAEEFLGAAEILRTEIDKLDASIKKTMETSGEAQARQGALNLRTRDEPYEAPGGGAGGGDGMPDLKKRLGDWQRDLKEAAQDLDATNQVSIQKLTDTIGQAQARIAGFSKKQRLANADEIHDYERGVKAATDSLIKMYEKQIDARIDFVRAAMQKVAAETATQADDLSLQLQAYKQEIQNLYGSGEMPAEAARAIQLLEERIKAVKFSETFMRQIAELDKSVEGLTDPAAMQASLDQYDQAIQSQLTLITGLTEGTQARKDAEEALQALYVKRNALAAKLLQTQQDQALIVNYTEEQMQQLADNAAKQARINELEAARKSERYKVDAEYRKQVDRELTELTGKQADQMQRVLDIVSATANGMADLGRATGLMSDKLADAVQAVSRLAEGFQKLADAEGDAAKEAAAWVQIIGAAANVASGLAKENSYAGAGAAIGGAAGSFFGPVGGAVGSFVGGVIGGLFGKSKDGGRLSGNAQAYAAALKGDADALQFLLEKSPVSVGGGGGWATRKAQEDAWAKYQAAKRYLAKTAAENERKQADLEKKFEGGYVPPVDSPERQAYDEWKSKADDRQREAEQAQLGREYEARRDKEIATALAAANKLDSEGKKIAREFQELERIADAAAKGPLGPEGPIARARREAADEALRQLEEYIDKSGKEKPERLRSALEVTHALTETTAGRLIGELQTQTYYLRRIATATELLAGIKSPAGVAPGGFAINVNVNGTPTGAQVGAEAAAAYDKALGARTQAASVAAGNPRMVA